MQPQSDAGENLRIIRSLMEKATIYRAISAPGALAGGSIAAIVSITGVFLASPSIPAEDEIWWFFVPWLAVFVVAGVFNLWLLGQDGTQGGSDTGFHVSERMRTALGCMLPGLLAGGFCAILQSALEWSTIASLWVLLYGVSLLSTGFFSPTSIRVLGWTFFAAGAVLLIAGAIIAETIQTGDANPLALAHGIMGTTFGLFHIVYAICVWPRRANV
ncbi:MAG TPA: hypothetical protein VIT91_18475 [Chthoniobacterales bacterium]